MKTEKIGGMKTIIVNTHSEANAARDQLAAAGFTRYYVDEHYEYYSKGKSTGTRYTRIKFDF